MELVIRCRLATCRPRTNSRNALPSLNADGNPTYNTPTFLDCTLDGGYGVINGRCHLPIGRGADGVEIYELTDERRLGGRCPLVGQCSLACAMRACEYAFNIEIEMGDGGATPAGYELHGATLECDNVDDVTGATEGAVIDPHGFRSILVPVANSCNPNTEEARGVGEMSIGDILDIDANGVGCVLRVRSPGTGNSEIALTGTTLSLRQWNRRLTGLEPSRVDVYLVFVIRLGTNEPADDMMTTEPADDVMTTVPAPVPTTAVVPATTGPVRNVEVSMDGEEHARPWTLYTGAGDDDHTAAAQVEAQVEVRAPSPGDPIDLASDSDSDGPAPNGAGEEDAMWDGSAEPRLVPTHDSRCYACLEGDDSETYGELCVPCTAEPRCGTWMHAGCWVRQIAHDCRRVAARPFSAPPPRCGSCRGTIGSTFPGLGTFAGVRTGYRPTGRCIGTPAGTPELPDNAVCLGAYAPTTAAIDSSK